MSDDHSASRRVDVLAEEAPHLIAANVERDTRMATADDPRIGVILHVRAEHAGHYVTIERRDIDKHEAYWFVCSCGKRNLIGSHWLDRAIEQGTIAHGAV